MTVRRALPRLHLSLRPSCLLAVALSIGHLTAAAAAAGAISDPTLAWIAGALFVAHGGRVIYDHALLRALRSVRALELGENGDCLAWRRNGAMLPCRLSADSYVMPWLIVLRLLPEHRYFAIYVVLLPDSSSKDALRRLRVHLRWSSASGRTGSATDTPI